MVISLSLFVLAPVLTLPCIFKALSWDVEPLSKSILRLKSTFCFLFKLLNSLGECLSQNLTNDFSFLVLVGFSIDLSKHFVVLFNKKDKRNGTLLEEETDFLKFSALYSCSSPLEVFHEGVSLLREAK